MKYERKDRREGGREERKKGEGMEEPKEEGKEGRRKFSSNPIYAHSTYYQMLDICSVLYNP